LYKRSYPYSFRHRPYERPRHDCGAIDAVKFAAGASSVCGVKGCGTSRAKEGCECEKAQSLHVDTSDSSAAIMGTRLSFWLPVLTNNIRGAASAYLMSAPALDTPRTTAYAPPKYHKGDAGGRCQRMGNTFGHLFRITTGANRTVGQWVWWSTAARHGSLSPRRIFRPNLTAGDPVRVALHTTPEEDVCHIYQGVRRQTLGTPISILVWNTDANLSTSAVQHLYAIARRLSYDANMASAIGRWRTGERPETIGRVAAGPSRKSCCGAVRHRDRAYVKQIHKSTPRSIRPQ